MNGKKEAEERARKRISQEVFRRTEPAPAQQPATETPPIAQEEPAPTGQVQEKKPIRKSRAWDRKPENRLYSYRTGADLDELIGQAVSDYEADGWHTTKSEVLRAWALAGRELWLEGKVEVMGRSIGMAGTKPKTASSGD